MPWSSRTVSPISLSSQHHAAPASSCSRTAAAGRPRRQEEGTGGQGPSTTQRRHWARESRLWILTRKNVRWRVPHREAGPRNLPGAKSYRREGGPQEAKWRLSELSSPTGSTAVTTQHGQCFVRWGLAGTSPWPQHEHPTHGSAHMWQWPCRPGDLSEPSRADVTGSLVMAMLTAMSVNPEQLARPELLTLPRSPPYRTGTEVIEA